MNDQSSSEPSQTVHELEQQRRANRDGAVSLGLRPYGDRVDGLLPLEAAKRRYDASADEDHQKNAKSEGFVDRRPAVKVAGRVMLLRDNGKLIWMNLRDETGDLQIAVSKRDCDETGFGLAKLTDLGDIVVGEGRLMKTRTGEVTVWCEKLGAGAKCLVPPPEKHAGLQDVELRYRQRYIDMWSNPETVRVFKLRSEIFGALRAEMVRRGYTEVETPMLQAQAGGAAARPFVTHMNALDMDLYLRIAPELYLKRLLVGGLSKVFEINRNFRNEGLDKQHNPEFTMLEAYCAFGDVETVMELTESLVRVCAQRVGELQGSGPALAFGDLRIDYEKAFRRTAYGDLFEQALGFDMSDTGRARDEAKRRNIRTINDKGEEIDDAFVVNELFESFAEPTIDPSVPTFITHYPAAISPLTRANVDNPALSDRSDLFIGGMEIAPNYTELNDPDVQAERFRSQLVGIGDDEATFRTFDEDFVRALRVGMPPAGGMGLGVDRLTMLLTDQRTIRDVILFPLLRRSGG